MDQSDGEEGCDETVATCDDERVTHDTSVTNISVESEGSVPGPATTSVSSLATQPASPARVNILQSDISPIISPWSSRLTNVTSEHVTRDNVTRLDVTREECDADPGHGQLSSMAQPHPFIYRVQNQLHLASSASPGQLRVSPGKGRSPARAPDPFKKILAAADDNICQAESILSSLGYDGLVTSGLADNLRESEGEEMASGLGSDIETNIRRLEKTQAKINAALETFRNVQNKQGNIIFNSTENTSNEHKNGSFCSLPPHEISAVEKLKKPEPVTTATVKNGERKERKTSIIRRHSFNNLASKEKAPADGSSKRESMYLYDGDIDSSEDRTNRNSSAYEDASDNEGNTSPFKSRIRGIFGSFGKGKKYRLHSEENFINSDKKLITIEYPDTETGSERDSGGTFSIGHFTELVKSLPAHQFSGRESPANLQSSSDCLMDGKTGKKATFLRPRDPDKVNSRVSKSSLCHNNSSDTYSSISTTQSINMSSNRNSVISTRSNSSESYNCDQGGDTTSDPGEMEMTSSTSPKDARSVSNDYISASKAQEKKVFYIAKEIMTSEKTYVDVLKLINIDFRDYVQKARLESKSGILPDHDFVKLFSNLPELMMLNEDLLRDFQERINNWDNHKKIADVIIKKGPYLKLYTVYIRDFSAMNFHFDEVCQRYPKFGKLVKEFEKQPRCGNLKLKHFMLKPVQRLPQYKLLLEDYLKHLDTDSIDWDDTTLALKIVSDAAEHANNTVKQGVSQTLRLDSVHSSLFPGQVPDDAEAAVPAGGLGVHQAGAGPGEGGRARQDQPQGGDQSLPGPPL